MKMKEFPLGSQVLIYNIVNQKKYNGSLGVIQSNVTSEGRQTIHILYHPVNKSIEKKSVRIKVENLKWYPRDIESLTTKEMKKILNKTKTAKELSGLNKNDLKALVKETIGSEEEIASILNEPQVTVKKSSNVSGSLRVLDADEYSNERMKQEARLYEDMTPDQIRQLRPSMAKYSDEQIRVAVQLLKKSADDPEIHQALTKEMDDDAYEEIQNSFSSSASFRKGHQMPPSHDKFKENKKDMSDMTPDRLRNVASVLKYADIKTLQRMNPLFSLLSQEQIQMTIAQMENMANNPDETKTHLSYTITKSPDETNEIPNSGPQPQRDTIRLRSKIMEGMREVSTDGHESSTNEKSNKDDEMKEKVVVEKVGTFQLSR